MSNTVRTCKNYTYKDKDGQPPKRKTTDRKSFRFRGEAWATKAGGGEGNKRGWAAYQFRSRFHTVNDPNWEEKIPLKQGRKKRPGSPS